MFKVAFLNFIESTLVIEKLNKSLVEKKCMYITSDIATLDNIDTRGLIINYDVLFVDLRKNTKKCLSVLKNIRLSDKDVLIILVADNLALAQVGFEIKAFRYILSPVTNKKISLSLSYAISELQDSKKYIICNDRTNIIINLDDIYYFESINRRIYAYEIKNKISFYAVFKNLESDLYNRGFFRCHQSYLINITKIQQIDRAELVLESGRRIPISRKYNKNVKENFNNYINKKRLVQNSIIDKCIFCRHDTYLK